MVLVADLQRACNSAASTAEINECGFRSAFVEGQLIPVHFSRDSYLWVEDFFIASVVPVFVRHFCANVQANDTL